MKKNKKQNIKLAALVLILLLGLGFAALAANLKIDGTVNVAKTSWDVHFENVSITEGSVTANPAPTSNNTDTTEMTYTINFTKPGDYFEFTTDIVNDGTIDAMVDVVSNNAYANASSTSPITLPTYLTSTVTYSDGLEIQPNQELKHDTSEKIKVRVEFKKDINISDLPSDGNTSIVFKFIGDYKQADDNSIPVRVDISTASWDEITTAYENNPSSLQQSMENGTTKEVQLDLDNDGTAETTAHLRIANLSTPEECSTQGFSQTACGLVLEFADVITTHRMNPYDNSGNSNGDGNRGGWEYSDMRAFLNSKKYLEGETGEVDYTSTGIYSALPSELRNKIIETRVVSGYGPGDTTNFTTTDKIYLFSPHEVWEDVDGNTRSGIDYYDKSYSYTRQLDYYKAKGVTTSAYSGAVKKNLSGSATYWWLRSARSDHNDYFFSVSYIGYWGYYISIDTNGVAPAFRIR